MISYDVADVLGAIDPAACDYQEWVDVGMALKAEGYGCDAWEAWSRADARRFHEGECERKWRSFRSDGVAGGTLVAMARRAGWEPDRGRALDWSMTSAVDDRPASGALPATFTPAPGSGGRQGTPEVPAMRVVDPAWVEAEELAEPQGAAWSPGQQVRDYLNALFAPEDVVGYVTEAFFRDGRWAPAGKGCYTETAGEIAERVALHGDDLASSIGQPNPEAGAWVRFNPLTGDGVRNDDVAEYRYALVESDTVSPGRQMAIIRALELPCAAVVHSGNKSLHAIVRVDAKDYAQYRERVDLLYRACADNGLELDRQNKNPSRLSRLPGVERGGRKQWLVATAMGRGSWDEWREWLDEQNDDLPDPESLADTWDDLPELAPPLIEGVLRRGHKMLVAGPSKAGKSFLLIALCVAVAEGREWLGWRCERGRVLYVNLELDRASCLHRFHDVYRALGAPPAHMADIAVWNLRGRSKPMDQLAPSLIRRAQKTRPALVVIDPIYKVITGDENSADQMAAFCNQFDKVADSLGCSVVYCHHHSKGLQGQKRSMDRASGSGVFARDPDALLDMIELHVTDDLRAAKESAMVRGVCGKCLDELAPGWEEREPWGGDSDLLPHARQAASAAGLERDLLDAVLDARRRAQAMTAWRVDGTLREFGRFEPKGLWFDWPTHRVDGAGELKDASDEGEALAASAYRAQGRERKARNDERGQRQRLAALREGMAACAEDGVEATKANVLERMPEVAGKAVTAGQLNNWLKSSTKWCPITVKHEPGKTGVLIDPEGEMVSNMMSGW